MKIAFRTRDSILNHLANHNRTQKASYTSSGVYKLTRPDCNKAYRGQAGRSFSTRFIENKQAAKNNSTSSNFAKHINEQAHSFGTIDNTMGILKKQRKGPHLNTLERFYIHKEASINNHLNDDHTVIPNRVFDTILKMQCPHHHHQTIQETVRTQTCQQQTGKQTASTSTRTDTSSSIMQHQCRHIEDNSD
jgi:hypothetical protein